MKLVYSMGLAGILNKDICYEKIKSIMIPHQELLNWVLDLAQKNNIQVQLDSEIGYGQDGSKVQGSGSGVPSVNIGVPIRYAHQQAGMFDKRDYDQAVKLVSLIVTHLNQQVVEQIKAG